MSKTLTLLAASLILIALALFALNQPEKPSQITSYEILEPETSETQNISVPIAFQDEGGDFGNPQNSLAWDHMPLTYSLAPECVGPIIPRIELALNELTNRTAGAVSFEKTDKNADISFLCSKEKIELSTDGITLGQAYYNTLGNEIVSAQIQFGSVTEDSRPSSCPNYPQLELHEILHVFGYEHNEQNHYSIMFPFEDGCNEIEDTVSKVTINGKSFRPGYKIDDDILRDLVNKYSNLP